jgi:hypothetical protein
MDATLYLEKFKKDLLVVQPPLILGQVVEASTLIRDNEEPTFNQDPVLKDHQILNEDQSPVCSTVVHNQEEEDQDHQ